MNLRDIRLAVIGLGYVGLPLAVEFGRLRSVVDFDINPARVKELNAILLGELIDVGAVI